MPTDTTDKTATFARLMDARSRAMIAGYASGLYPIPLAKRQWAADLITGLVASGEIPADHRGEICIRLTFRGDNRQPDVKLGAVVDLN